ncbi:UNVERIFIED_ORG: unknown [Staphylococcus phage SA1]
MCVTTASTLFEGFCLTYKIILSCSFTLAISTLQKLKRELPLDSSHHNQYCILGQEYFLGSNALRLLLSSLNSAMKSSLLPFHGLNEGICSRIASITVLSAVFFIHQSESADATT